MHTKVTNIEINVDEEHRDGIKYTLNSDEILSTQFIGAFVLHVLCQFDGPGAFVLYVYNQICGPYFKKAVFR